MLRLSKYLYTEICRLKLLNATTDPKFVLEKSPFDDEDEIEAPVLSNQKEMVVIGRIFPESEIYREGAFRIEIRLPPRFPFDAPEVRFLTPIYHPNVSVDGKNNLEKNKIDICVFSLGRFCPAILEKHGTLGYTTILVHVIRHVVRHIDKPDILFAASIQLAREYMGHSSEFDRKALEYVKEHALPRIPTDAFNFGELPKKATFLFVSSEFAATMKNKPEQVETVFILEYDKNKVDNRERFATDEDIICQLADEIYRCYEKEAREYSEYGDPSIAKIKEEQANRIHIELKKIHQRLFARNITTDTTICTITTLVWLKSKLQDDIEVEKVKNLFSKGVSSFLVFDSLFDCHKDLLEHEVVGNIFLIIDADYEESVVVDFQQLPNVKVVGRYGQSSLENEAIIDNYDDLCSRLTHDLIAHYNRLGTECSKTHDAKTAKDMFMKAHKLCNIDSEF
ncbi:unnamed protein product [Rotaria sp. Silwood2]|nr:unnamed protein product [Rotaria sp. Silwood2]CAF3048977.1 unnamed protein product [Rotaria sp. Silwood2]CAF3411511.1 unnamed protein product [Rotaria sp. Silwood2]CAF4392107.1 unnamed protein product [Rotaria sp. Silwood2]CAF4439647.1 unnamed protein product [Rotaria sp. Silwood2]